MFRKVYTIVCQIHTPRPALPIRPNGYPQPQHSKRGSASLRRTLFLVMGVLLQCAPMDEPIYQFMNKKRSEGKPYRVYMMASANKFLRIYYASVKAYLDSLEHN